jgi:uncharacterized protein YciW
MNSNKLSPQGPNATSEQIDELKRLLEDASSSKSPDVLRQVFEYASAIHSQPDTIRREAGA